MSFAHLTIATPNIERTARFYEQTMRWPRVSSPGNAPLEVIWLQIGPRQQIHIIHVKDFRPSPFEDEFGRHFAFFHAVGDFPELKQRLVEAGAELIDAVRPTPFERFFFRDPNGYVIEVIAQEQYVTE
jgi:catechol 2,3-dioxygenase-like lactoylglutathione lyase family enzyme